MPLRRRLLAPLLGLLLAAASTTAATAAMAANNLHKDPQVQAFIAHMVTTHGFAQGALEAGFARLQRNAVVLKAIQPPASPRQRSWERYRARFLNARRIDGGVRFIAEHGAELRRAEAIYDVPREIIAAIIGVETEYGRITGRFRVAEALATLAFHYPPRAPFFRSELEAFFLLARDNGFDPFAVRGSFAGAIGIPQFMPSSQQRYAVDFDGDGRIDLRASNSDAIGSVARFLQQHGWVKDGPVAVPAEVQGDPAPLLAEGIRPQRPLGMLPGIVATADPALAAALIDLETSDAPTEYWAGFDNFYVLTRYNRSSFYAMSVFQLAEALRAATHPQ